MRQYAIAAMAGCLLTLGVLPATAAPNRAACKDCPFPFQVKLYCIADPSGIGLRCRQANVRRANRLISCFTAGGSDVPFPLRPAAGGTDPFPLKCATGQ